MPSTDKEALTMEPWAAVIGLATLALITCVAAFTAWDRFHNASLETVITPTAVGDTHFVKEPPARTGPIGLKYQGRQLDMVEEDKFRDAKLLQAGTDDSGLYWLYLPEDEKDAIPAGRYYMKIADDSYMQVTQEPSH